MPVLPQQFMVACGKVMCVRFNLNRDARSSSTLYKSRALVPPDGFNLNRDARSSSTRSHDGPDHSNAGFQSQPRCPFFLNIACANSLVAHGGRFNLNRDARSSSTTNLIGYVVNEHPFQSQPRCPFFLNDLLRAIASGEVAFQSQPRCPFFLNKGEVFRSFRERKFQSQPRCPFFLNRRCLAPLLRRAEHIVCEAEVLRYRFWNLSEASQRVYTRLSFYAIA